MEFALILRELMKRWPLLLLGVLVAAVAAVFSVYRLEGANLKARSLQHSSATTQVLVDTPASVLGSLSQSFEPLSTRAEVYANFMTSPAILALVGQQAGLSGEQIYAAGPVNANEPRVIQEPTALRRNVEITGETTPYRLGFESQANLPTITINAQAPTTPQAIRLANAAVGGLQLYVSQLEKRNKTPSSSQVTIRQLGSAHGGVVDGGISKALAALVFVGVFLLWCVLMLVGTRFARTWRDSAVLADAWGQDHGLGVRPAGASGEDDILPQRDAVVADMPQTRTPAPAESGALQNRGVG